MEMEKLRAVLIKYGVPFDEWESVLQKKMLRHINAEKVEICEAEGLAYCLTIFAVVDVQHKISSTLMQRLVEDGSSRANFNQIKRARPQLGVNVKVGLKEGPWHAARRAVIEKLYIKNPVGIEFVTKDWEWIHDTQFTRLKSHLCLFVFRYEMPANLYKPYGHTFEKTNGKEVFFKWMPVGINVEHRIAP